MNTIKRACLILGPLQRQRRPVPGVAKQSRYGQELMASTDSTTGTGELSTVSNGRWAYRNFCYFLLDAPLILAPAIGCQPNDLIGRQAWNPRVFLRLRAGHGEAVLQPPELLGLVSLGSSDEPLGFLLGRA